MTIIGDVHGNVSEYQNIISNCKKTICVGDFGFKKEWDQLLNPNHKINMGNHDYIPYVNHPCSCGNWSYNNNIFTVRGANSIDKHLRIEGRDWFSNEELNYQEQLDAYDAYILYKPEIVISHDCPQLVMTSLFGYNDKSQTRIMLQHMFEGHKPKLWVFGHHHRFKDVNILGTRFICLDELQTIKI